MPQARSGGSKSRSSSGSRSSGSRSTAKRSTTSRSTTKRPSASRSTAKRSSTSRARTTATRSRSGADARFDAAANRLRKLNERIIDAGKEAGETTLASYEKALKTIAATIERGPGSSDIEWISNLATAQAKFIRDLTTSWTSAARKVLR